jgi:hypothetical protein
VNRRFADHQPIGNLLVGQAAACQLTQGAVVAYQCAQPQYWEWPQKFPLLQAAIVDGLAGTGTRLVIGKNTYMYGDTDGKPLTEEPSYTAHTRKGKVRAAMAEAALAAHRASVTVVKIEREAALFPDRQALPNMLYSVAVD